MADEIAYNIGSLPPLPDGELLDTDMVEVERTDTPKNSNFRMTVAELRAALGGVDAAQTGDVLITARSPGEEWLELNSVYLQSEHPALFSEIGKLYDRPPGANYTASASQNGRAASKYATITDTKLIGVGNGVIWRSNDGGTTWASETVTLGNMAGVWALPSGVYIFSETGLYRSVDGGVTFTKKTTPTGSTAGIPPISITESLGRIFFIFDTANASNRIVYSDDFCETWVTPPASPSSVIAFVNFGGGHLWLGVEGAGTTYWSFDNGTSFSTGVPLPGGNLIGGNGQRYDRYDYGDSSGLILIPNSGSVYRSEDFGNTFTTVSGFTGAKCIVRAGDRFLAISNSAGSNNKYSDDFGKTWSSAVGSTTASTRLILGVQNITVVSNSGTGAATTSYGYEYDTSTQFKTPKVGGIGIGLRGYIKS